MLSSVVPLKFGKSLPVDTISIIVCWRKLTALSISRLFFYCCVSKPPLPCCVSPSLRPLCGPLIVGAGPEMHILGISDLLLLPARTNNARQPPVLQYQHFNIKKQMASSLYTLSTFRYLFIRVDCAACFLGSFGAWHLTLTASVGTDWT